MKAPPSGEPPPSQPRPPEATPGGGASRLLSGAAGGTLAVLAAANVLGHLDRSVVAALFESLRADLWLTDARLGLLGSGFALAYVLASPLLGTIGDRGSRPRLLALGVGAWSVAAILSGLARGFWTLLAARVAVGLGQAVPGALGPGLLADRFGPDRRARAFAVFFAAAPMGAALGYAAGGLVDRALGWRAALALAGAPALALAIACLRVGEPPRGGAGRGWSLAAEAGIAATWRRLAANRRYALAVAGYAAHTFAVAAMSWWMPAFLERTRGVPRPLAAVAYGAIVALTGLLGTFAGGYVADGLRRRLREADLWVCGTAALAAAAAALVAFATWRPALYLAGLVLAQVLLFACLGPANAAMTALVPPPERAGTIALSVLAAHLVAEVPAPWLVGLVSDHGSLARAVLAVPAAILAAGALWTWAAWRGERERRLRL